MSKREFLLAAEEFDKKIEEKFNACVNNKKFRRNETQIKRSWYRQHLRNRIAFKVWLYERPNIYNLILDTIDELLPEKMYGSLDEFVNVEDLREDKIKGGYGDTNIPVFTSPLTLIDTQRVDIGCKYIK